MPRTDPKSPEHRAKISEALKAYNARPDSHLRSLHGSGEDHPNFRGGIKPDYYRGKAFAKYGRVCNRCRRTHKPDGTALYLVVHHRDENRRNSHIDNLEVLCRTCHQQHHHGKRVTWTCPACGTLLQLQPYWAARRKFCSNACRMAKRGTDGRF